MGVKVTSKENGAVKKYPWTGVTDNGKIVTFHREDSGQIVYPAGRYGEYSTSWIEENFKAYKGVLTIEID